ncbi:hypothetical protein CEXT_579671 [Caerostris extrusa]|uniref:Uncharacterized protein n=1 Tax=Caerostris extrusa TaxID=172846 RepID=A0AAV4SMV7_CAEEX|nr:hypothetical protein CEXT_579671 [Caerostris extrusa]
MTCESVFYETLHKQTYLQALGLCEVNIVYVFVLGDQGTGKTTLIDYLTTRRIADPLLPSFRHVSESPRWTELVTQTKEMIIDSMGH